LAAAGYEVTLLPAPLPTPILAFAVRHFQAAAGIQITASHNPARDNGYKVFLADGAQLVSPADREIEALIQRAPAADQIPRTPVEPSGAEVVDAYLTRIAQLPRTPVPERASLRIALTALHGVGGDIAVRALAAAGVTDVHVVAAQHDPDPDFPTVAFPNPEEPGTTDALLDLAAAVDADLAIALDPDADRCAIGVCGPDGWRMLRGDETGVLLGEYFIDSAPADALVATTIVSSTLLNSLAQARGVRSARTLTGFKWLTRAGDGLIYAYEEAIGMCVDPEHVRDKDGIGAAVMCADLAVALGGRSNASVGGRTFLDQLDALAVEFGVHAVDQVSLRVDDLADIAAMTTRLRAAPPSTLAGEEITVDDLLDRPEPQRTDALVLTGPTATGRTVRMVARPSGTEPKLKCYLEVIEPVADHDDLTRARDAAEATLEQLRQYANSLAAQEK
ncbi:MAG: phospho-sugar mutase, partial [Rhodococcus sp.]|nr:phospho-sugar mutase [Rhodococcus sp. (in: high G+C Gram-positive bacteria)]